MNLALVFLALAAAASYGLFRTVRGQAASTRYLEEAVEVPLQIGHLSKPLQRVARETRALRLSLEEPMILVKDAEGLLGGETPRSDLERELMNASRDLGEWVRLVERLPEEELAQLRDLGVDYGPVRDAMAREGWSLELRRKKATEKLSVRLHRILGELERIERAMQVQADPYR